MNKNNFFNFKNENIWDIGWPCGPRKFLLLLIPVLILIFILT